MGTKRISAFLSGFILVSSCFSACGGGSSDNGIGSDTAALDSITWTSGTPEPGSTWSTGVTISGTDLKGSYVKWNGRNYYHSASELNYFFYVCSGFTVKFHGTELKAVMCGKNTSTTTRNPVFQVLVDSTGIDSRIDANSTSQIVVQKESVLQMTGSSEVQEVTLVSGLDDTDHTVTLYKQGDASWTVTALKKLNTDGYFVAAETSSALKIQCIGSSAITGHGSLVLSTTNGVTGSSLNSSGLYSLSGLVANAYNAEVEHVSVGGWGLCKTDKTMQDVYDYIGIVGDGVSYKVNTAWDHSTWHPDIVILNIGGNDTTAGYTESEVKTGMKALQSKIHAAHPNAKIIWTGKGTYGTYITTAIAELVALDSTVANYTVYTAIYSAGTNATSGSTVYYGGNVGGANHPSIDSGLDSAKSIITKLKLWKYSPLRSISLYINDSLYGSIDI